MLFSTTLVASIAVAASMANAAVIRRQAMPGDYTLVFTNQDAAVQGTDFITFGLFETTAECTAFCDAVSTCGFANSYHDNNGKGGSPLLTCSLYASCYDESSLTNTGGQTQPDGTVNFITASDGWCKVPTDPTTTAPPVTSTPVTTTDPTTDPVTDPAPTSTADPTTTPEPTSTADPTTAPEPTSTADPTTAEPTSTADPTTDPAPEPTSTADPTTDPAPEPTSTA